MTKVPRQITGERKNKWCRNNGTATGKKQLLDLPLHRHKMITDLSVRAKAVKLLEEIKK